MKMKLLPDNLLGAILIAAALGSPPVYSTDTDNAPPAADVPDAILAASPDDADPEADSADTPAAITAESPDSPVADAPVPAVADTPEAAPAEAYSAQAVLAYQHDIEAIESNEGAYAGKLPESLLSLGLMLQAQGRHDEAIKVFRRGVHLARINEGLYCTQQIPLLQGEIASHKAVQDYAVADERQNYLYRVQTHSMSSGEELAGAFMQQAQWQYDAYQLGLDQQGYTRLMQMSDLYRLALQDVITREGETSPKLLAPLYGMLQAQYLISSYEVPEPLPTTFGEVSQIDESLIRFKTYRSQSYQQGNAIIEAIAGINKEQAAPDSKTMAETLVMLGDWRLWNGKTDAAWEAYREAETELASSNDAQSLVPQLFGEPVALPAIADLSPLPPVVAPEQADVTLEFAVNERGRVEDIERLDDNEAEDRQAYRLMKQLRKTTFRPRFEAGQPVETEKLVKAFDIQ